MTVRVATRRPKPPAPTCNDLSPIHLARCIEPEGHDRLTDWHRGEGLKWPTSHLMYDTPYVPKRVRTDIKGRTPKAWDGTIGFGKRRSKRCGPGYAMSQQVPLPEEWT